MNYYISGGLGQELGSSAASRSREMTLSWWFDIVQLSEKELFTLYGLLF
jgi:hypothetical protein